MTRYGFNPEDYERELVGIFTEINTFIDEEFEDKEKFYRKVEKVLKKYPKDYSKLFRRDQLISGLDHLMANEMLDPLVKADKMKSNITMKPTRTISGVTTVTVLTKPFDCPGKCVFCPNDVRMPKSYIATEPGAQRAIMNRFSPYLQVWNRLRALENIGHPTEKIELLVLGGTWSTYPEKYQIWFISECFRAMNDFHRESLDDKVSVPPLERGLGGVAAGKKFTHNNYNPKLLNFARENRKKQTPGEIKLWSKLRNKQIEGYKFLRQRPVDKYIADFLQPENKLIIEIDGMSHDDSRYDKDIERENNLKGLGYQILRFTEHDVKTRMNEVLESIYFKLDEATHPSLPSREGTKRKNSDKVPSLGRGLGRGAADNNYKTDDSGFKYNADKLKIREYLQSDWNDELRKETGDMPYNELIKTEEFTKGFNQYICSEDSALKPSEGWKELEKLHDENSKSNCRCVGLVLETRPDSIREKEAFRLRRLGATKIQLGIQTLDDEVSKLNKRGEGRVETGRAFQLLRMAGFKIHAHMMPNLYGATPEGDRKTYHDLFELLDYKPDEVKIYPTSVIKHTELHDYYQQGKYRPYDTPELVDLIADLMEDTPEYCRLTRIIRDIPSTEIEAGNKTTNLREIVEWKLAKEKRENPNIRAREIKGKVVTLDDLHLDTIEYETTWTTELFMQYITEDRKIAGFLRLSLPKYGQMNREGEQALTRLHNKRDKIPSPPGEGGSGSSEPDEVTSVSSHDETDIRPVNSSEEVGLARRSLRSLDPMQKYNEMMQQGKNPTISELDGCAMIREIHVYGPSLELSKNSKGEAQHLGLGSKLIEKAKEITKEKGFEKLAVISAIGTREYYEKRGFKLKEYYQIAKL